LYHDMGLVVDALTDQQAGQLLKAILAHVRMEYYEIEDPVVQIAFLPIRQTLERDHEKYLGIVDRNRANGSKGGRPRKNPVGYLGTQEKPKEPKKADRDIGKDIDTDKEKKGTNVPKEKAAPSQSLVEFESFWSGCQKKVGKPAALKAWQKMRKENRTTLTGEQLLERYNSIVEMETKERGTAQYVPHPATWINQDRWDDDVIEPMKKYPFNQRVYYVTTEDTHPLNHDILAWVLDRKWYCDDKTGKVFNDKGELQTNITIDPEGDLEKW